MAGVLPRAPWGTFPSEVHELLDTLDDDTSIVVSVKVTRKYEEVAVLEASRAMELFALLERFVAGESTYVRITATVDDEAKAVSWVTGAPQNATASVDLAQRWLIKHLSEQNIKLQAGTAAVLTETAGLIRRLGRASGEQMRQARRLAEEFRTASAETKAMELEHLRFETYAELAKEWVPRLIAGRGEASGATTRILAALTGEEREAVLKTEAGKQLQAATSPGDITAAMTKLFAMKTAGELDISQTSIDAVWQVIAQLDKEHKARQALDQSRAVASLTSSE